MGEILDQNRLKDGMYEPIYGPVCGSLYGSVYDPPSLSLLQEDYYSQFSFRPEIDGHSRKLGRAATTEEHTAMGCAALGKPP